jgi:sulfur relay protein TusB/DsrH
MRTPSSEEDSERLFCLTREDVGQDIAIYLLGDAVLCARKGQSGHHGTGVRETLRKGAQLRACARDLRARGIRPEDVESGIEVVEDLEGVLIEDVMEHEGRVVSW